MVLTNRVVMMRVKGDKWVGDRFQHADPQEANQGEPDELYLATRCHQNFIENVPLAFVLAAIAELNGANRKVLNYCMAALFVLRIAHVELGLRGKGAMGTGRALAYFGTQGFLGGLAAYSTYLVKGYWGYWLSRSIGRGWTKGEIGLRDTRKELHYLGNMGLPFLLGKSGDGLLGWRDFILFWYFLIEASFDCIFWKGQAPVILSWNAIHYRIVNWFSIIPIQYFHPGVLLDHSRLFHSGITNRSPSRPQTAHFTKVYSAPTEEGVKTSTCLEIGNRVETLLTLQLHDMLALIRSSLLHHWPISESCLHWVLAICVQHWSVLGLRGDCFQADGFYQLWVVLVALGMFLVPHLQRTDSASDLVQFDI
jgi:uncharacterized membrane protein YecN with MAPEG domain